ncbi:hypothetical protein CPARA_1gp152 (nucleomorph) [Cryptomonas paramecium]|uniref:Uncharacterized protein n=1 Tax=Cryptomonas paramaecium TaxID=2898 RepID=F2HHL4_9CRYP|nr:hypothetical protein CPARA_1gp152 [Cryptomonas paramecium]AEA38810.1 hypothetical protein CPARA_1gp152 [Cryptomonas paramecium]
MKLHEICINIRCIIVYMMNLYSFLYRNLFFINLKNWKKNLHLIRKIVFNFDNIKVI